jgi:hypothetical protein
MPVSQAEMALSRGRVPTYLRRRLHELIHLLLTQRGRRGQMMARMSRLYLIWLLSPNLFFSFRSRNSQRSSSLLLSTLFDTDYRHYTSYDMNVRPTNLFHDPPMENPVEELPAATFFQLIGFWPGHFEEVINNLLLLLYTVVFAATRSS